MHILWMGIIHVIFSFRIFVWLVLFLLRRVSKHLFLESLRSFQAVCIGVCVDRLAMLPQYYLGDLLHDRILPNSPMSPVHTIRKHITSSFHQKSGIFLACTTIVILKTMALKQHSPEGCLFNRLHTITH